MKKNETTNLQLFCHIIDKMKLLFTFLFLMLTSVLCSQLYAQQEVKISIDQKNKLLSEMLNEIESKSGYSILVRKNDIDTKMLFSITVEKKSIEEILDLLFKEKNISYTINGKSITIYKPQLKQKEPLEKISGRVIDSKGEPLIGASVFVKETKIGVITDISGEFTLTTPKQAIISISFLGYKSQEIKLTSQKNLVITLEEDAKTLEEFVVVGYGTVKKSDLTGSVAVIKSEDLANVKVGLVSNSMQGLATGVLVQQGSQKPGGGASILIRGQGTLNAGSSPLVLIDGIPGDINDLAINDIGSVEILKDASSASIYGSRGSNGVILVTTKQGQKGEIKINVVANYGLQSLMNKQRLMNADQYYEIVNLVNGNYPWSSDELRNLTAGKSTDWQGEVSQQGNYQNYNLSISQGNEKNTHFLGIDWYDNKGIIKKSSYNRANLRYNMNMKINESLRSGLHFNFIETSQKNVNEDDAISSNYGTMHSAITAQPTAPVYSSNGKYFDNFLNTKANPVAIVELTDKPIDKTRIVGSVFFEFEPIKNLIFKTDNGGETRYVKLGSHTEPTFGQHYKSEASLTYQRYIFMQSENTITYNLELDNHKLTMLGGFSASKALGESVTAIGTTVNPILGYNNLGTASNFGPDASNKGVSTLTSFFTRLNYSLKDKYLLTVTMRADGSSRFAPRHQWGYFPSAALKWRASEEKFIKNVPCISNLGLRLSAGMLGNQDIGDYRFFSTIGQGGSFLNYTIGSKVLTGASQLSIGNPNLTWEKASTFDLGLDYGLFENRVYGSIDAYYKRTSDLLWEVPLPKESGYNTSLTNVGRIENKGIEFLINSVNFKKSFKWNTSFNFTYNKNVVASLYDNKTQVNNQIFVGKPIGVIYSYKADGIWQQNEAASAQIYNAIPGDRKILDTNNDNLITDLDRSFHGETRPVYFGSFQNTFQYAGFDFIVFCTYAGGYKIYNTIASWLDRYNVWGNMSEAYYNGYWTPERPSMKYPAPRIGALYADGNGTDAFFQKGDYIRIKNVEIGYNLPKSVLRTIKASNIRVYSSIQNLYTLTQFTGYDVESDSYNNPYPASRTYIFGISVNF